MEVIEHNIHHIIEEIKKIELKYHVKCFEYNNNTFYRNIWVDSWEEEIPNEFGIILNYMREKNITHCDDRLISIGIIESFPDCDDQPFHFDYLNNTMTVFIPLVDLDNDNGTEYIQMLNGNYDDVVDILMPLNYTTDSYDTLKHQLDFGGHAVKRVNSSKYNFVKLNKSVFHRGVKNMKPHNKKMIQFLFSNNPDYVFSFRDRFYSNAIEGTDDM